MRGDSGVEVRNDHADLVDSGGAERAQLGQSGEPVSHESGAHTSM